MKYKMDEMEDLIMNAVNIKINVVKGKLNYSLLPINVLYKMLQDYKNEMDWLPFYQDKLFPYDYQNYACIN